MTSPGTNRKGKRRGATDDVTVEMHNVVGEDGPEDSPEIKIEVPVLNFAAQLESIVRLPNVQSMKDAIALITGSRCSASSSVIGKLINPGEVGIISHNGRIQLVGEGRWILRNPRANWVEVVQVTKNPIICETLTIIRVPPGSYSLTCESGQPVILGEGLHAYNDLNFRHLNFVEVQTTYIKHMTLHILRVGQGRYAFCTDNMQPKVLPEGVYVVNSNLFSVSDPDVSVNQPHLKHNTINIIRVPKGFVALVTQDNLPKLLEHGTYFINSNVFQYINMENRSQAVIRHGTITMFRVRIGEIALCWEDNVPVFFESEGLFVRDSPLFQFDKVMSASSKQIVHGSKKIITVYDGEVGISFNNGKLVVLQPRTHRIDSAWHVFQDFLSTQQQCLSLSKQQEGGLLVCETKDFVEIGIMADVFYRVTNAEQMLLVVGVDKLIPLIRETSVATLNSIIRSTSLAEVAQAKEHSAISLKKHEEAMRSGKPGAPSAPLFFEKVHDEFISKLHDAFHTQYGVEIDNIRIEKFRIVNKELAENISKQALTTAQTDNQLTNLEGQTKIATVQQERDALIQKIQVQASAERLRTETEAKSLSTQNTAQAEANAVLIRAEAEAKAATLKTEAEARNLQIRAEAEAKALLMRSEAEAKAIHNRALAEAERAQLLSQTALGRDLALMAVHSDMVTGSLKGVSKIIYLPTDMAKNSSNPFGFFNVPGMPSTSALSERQPKA